MSSDTGRQDLIARDQFESVHKEAENVPLETQENHHNLDDSKNDDQRIMFHRLLKFDTR